jgi:hypothetical protein
MNVETVDLSNCLDAVEVEIDQFDDYHEHSNSAAVRAYKHARTTLNAPAAPKAGACIC